MSKVIVCDLDRFTGYEKMHYIKQGKPNPNIDPNGKYEAVKHKGMNVVYWHKAKGEQVMSYRDYFELTNKRN